MDDQNIRFDSLRMRIPCPIIRYAVLFFLSSFPFLAIIAFEELLDRVVERMVTRILSVDNAVDEVSVDDAAVESSHSSLPPQ